MPEPNEQHVFVVDDDLIERLLRGDTVDDPAKKKRPVESSALARAVQLAGENKLDEAVQELESAAEKGDHAVEVQTGLGHLRFEQQKWPEAARAYAKVAELEPQHRSAHYNLGLCLERQGKFEEAAREFEIALAIDPARWQARAVRGLCRLQLGQPEQALEDLNAALKEQPGHEQALFGKAVALHQLGKLEEAGEIYRKLTPSNTSSPELLVNLIAIASSRKEDSK